MALVPDWGDPSRDSFYAVCLGQVVPEWTSGLCRIAQRDGIAASHFPIKLTFRASRPLCSAGLGARQGDTTPTSETTLHRALVLGGIAGPDLQKLQSLLVRRSVGTPVKGRSLDEDLTVIGFGPPFHLMGLCYHPAGDLILGANSGGVSRVLEHIRTAFPLTSSSKINGFLGRPSSNSRHLHTTLRPDPP